MAVVVVVVVFLTASFLASFILQNNNMPFQRNKLQNCFSYHSKHLIARRIKTNLNKLKNSVLLNIIKTEGKQIE